MRRFQRFALGGVALLSLIACSSSFGQDKQPPTAKVDRSGAIIVPLQGSVRLQMKNKKFIRSVFFDRENVVQVLPDATKPDTVIVFGRGVGTVTLELTDVDGGKESFEVVVQQDIDLLRNLIKRAVPTANVEVIPGVGGLLIISGNVARAEDVDTILRIAAAVGGGQSGSIVNAMQVGGVHQVQLDVTVANVNRSKARQRGVNLLIGGTNVQGASILDGVATAALGGMGVGGGGGGTGSMFGSGMITATSNATNLVVGVLPAQVLTAIRALKNEGLAKLLAEPKLVTQSGRPARFLAGGQQATLSGASGINGPGVAYVDIGTELEFLPIVYGNGKIYLEVAPRVRGVNQGLGIVTSFGAVPGFDEQTVRTSIVLEPGQTFAIGGLIQHSVQSSSTRVPVLGEIPFLGALFSFSSITESEQELVILVTPHLVDAMDCNQVPQRLPGRETRTPDDFEFYLEAMLELPRGQRNVFEGRRYKAAWKNDPTAAQWPCGANGGMGGNCGVIGASHTSGMGCANGSCQPTTMPTISGPSRTMPSTMPSSLPSTLPGKMTEKPTLETIKPLGLKDIMEIMPEGPVTPSTTSSPPSTPRMP
jgi:pilus assembly protein CpaC